MANTKTTKRKQGENDMALPTKAQDKETELFYLPAGRASYPKLFKDAPSKMRPEEKKRDDGSTYCLYSTTILVPKSADISEIEAAIEAKAKEKFGKKWDEVKFPIRDGDTDKVYKKKPECNGHWVIAIRSYDREVSVGKYVSDGKGGKKVERITDHKEVYPGCWLKACVTLFTYDRPDSKGVSLGLRSLLKAKDDVAFVGSSDAAEDFQGQDFDDDENVEMFDENNEEEEFEV